MTVYAVQSPRWRNPRTGEIEARFDLTPAQAYGKVEELLTPTAKPFNPGPIVDELYVKLENFDDDDAIICIGNPILIALAVNVASDVNNGRVRLLQWHGHRGEYVPVDIDMGFTSDG